MNELLSIGNVPFLSNGSYSAITSAAKLKNSIKFLIPHTVRLAFLGNSKKAPVSGVLSANVCQTSLGQEGITGAII